jgi:hypothetical protein
VGVHPFLCTAAVQLVKTNKGFEIVLFVGFTCINLNPAYVLNSQLVLNTERGCFLHVILLSQLYWAENFETACELNFPQQEKYSYNI